MRLRPVDWRVITYIPSSLTLRELSRRSGVPLATAHRIYHKLRERLGLRVGFHVNYEAIHLLPVTALIPLHEVGTNAVLPPYTTRCRVGVADDVYLVVEAKVPPEYFQKYVSLLPAKPEVLVRGYEAEAWRPDVGLTLFQDGELKPKRVSDMDLELALKDPVRPWGTGLAPDAIDLAILNYKVEYAFKPLKEILREASRANKKFSNVSLQLASYHYRRHVLSYWRYNWVKFRIEPSPPPSFAFYVEGSEAYALARLAVNAPGIDFTIIDTRSAFVWGRPSPETLKLVYELLLTLSVEMPRGPLYLLDPPPLTLEGLIPLWDYAENRRWIWPEDKKIRLKVAPAKQSTLARYLKQLSRA